jgi:hypothetical protein
MEQLKLKIKELQSRLSQEDSDLINDEALKECSKFPFNIFANIFAVLLTKGDLKYNDFISIRNDYFKRNPYLDLFEKAPRTFGQTWGEAWLREQTGSLQIPPKRDGYKPQFDLWFPTEGKNGLKIEVKSSRVVKDDPELLLVERAYKRPHGTDEEIKEVIENELSFEMNFQQLKPDYCDIFIWIAVWLDDIDMWVIPSDKIIMRPKGFKRRKPSESIVLENGSIFMGVQHAGGKGGEVPEGQIDVTNKHFYDLKDYKVTLDNLIEKIKEYGNIN